MMRLKSKLLSLNASLPVSAKVKVFSPRNCEELRIPFKADKIAKVVGRLASMSIPVPRLLGVGENGDSLLQDDGEIVRGVLVENDFKLSLMAAEDLREYAGLTTTVVSCRQRMRLSAAGIDLIRWALEGTFGSIEEVPTATNGATPSEDTHINGNGEKADEEIARKIGTTYLVMGCVSVSWHSDGEIEIEWEGNMLNDGIADAVMAVLMSVESSPAAVRRKVLFSKTSINTNLFRIIE
jgi:cleavage and polyadenylation specificity factor subunit 3